MDDGSLDVLDNRDIDRRDANVVVTNVRLTTTMIVTCIMAASGGLIFGYDIGISGGVSTMRPFLEKFFPNVLTRLSEGESKDQYCLYDSQSLTAFTSSLYIAGLTTALLAGRVTSALGRRKVMLLGGGLFLAGATITGAAISFVMLILGRITLGCGVGFTIQATPLYLSELAPSRRRGALSGGYNLFLGVGVLSANLINYVTARTLRWGWRLSLGLAAAPAVIFLLGALLIPDSPSFLLARKDRPAARAALQRLRGRDVDIGPELAELERSLDEAVRSGKMVVGPYRTIVRRGYRHLLVMAVALPLFQHLTGIDVIAFYAPVLFRSLGFGSNGALMAAVIFGAVNLTSITASMMVVDRYGRRLLFFIGGAVMFTCQVAMACILRRQLLQPGNKEVMTRSYSIMVLAFTCLYLAGFGFSWGPLSFTVPAEIFPAEVRSAGQSINVAVGLASSFVMAQTFLFMLCHLKYGIFAFHAGWIVVMTTFVAALLPETKGVALEDMEGLWKGHWFWRRYYVRYEEME